MMEISSLQNPRVKELVRLRRKPGRTGEDVLLIEGYREIRRALDAGHPVMEFYFCRDFFLGDNEDRMMADAEKAGARLLSCTPDVFRKIAYKDRPEGLLAVGKAVGCRLSDLNLPEDPLLIVAESIEKPGNLGSILRSADAAGVDAVIVCDHCTDVNNPNVVRSSIGTIFTVPVAEASSDDTLAFLRERGIRVLAATPHTDRVYTDEDLTRGIALVVGTEKFGLSDRWMDQADLKVKLPMLGRIDSLNVACATTVLLYEAARQRGFRPKQ